MLCPDEQVRHAIERVFVLWRRLGSARQVVLELVAEGQQLPRRTVGQRRVRWARASYGAVHDFLTNPAYAGAFVFGRTRTEQARSTSTARSRPGPSSVPIERVVCLPARAPSRLCVLARVPRHARAAARQREAARRGRRRRARGRRAAAGPRALRALRPADAGRLFGQRRARRRAMRACAAFDLHGTDRPASRSAAAASTRPSPQAFLEAVTPAGVARHRRRGRASSRPSTTQRLAGQRLALERAAVRGRPRAPPVRRLRARAPPRRAHPRARARGQRSPPSSASAASSPRSSTPARRR